MKIKSVEPICHHHVIMDNGDEYRRLSPYNWEKLWGSSWEQVYINPSEQELEELFVQREMIMKLREQSGQGIMDCKKALLETNWNYEEAYKLVLNSDTFGKLVTPRRQYD